MANLIEFDRPSCGRGRGSVYHDEAWRSAYQGIIPAPSSKKLINRRARNGGQRDSQGQPRQRADFRRQVAGYANYGRNRARSLHFEGESTSFICGRNFRVSVRPRLSTAARRDFAERPEEHGGWALSITIRDGVYRAWAPHVRASENRAQVARQVAFAWTN